MTTETEALKALNAIEQQLDQQTSAPSGVLNQIDYCEQYNKLKPLLQKVLLWLDKYPPHGHKIAKVIRVLMTLADLACPN